MAFIGNEAFTRALLLADLLPANCVKAEIISSTDSATILRCERMLDEEEVAKLGWALRRVTCPHCRGMGECEHCEI